MEDLVPLAQALRDADPQVRSEAERAMWLVWSRSGDAEADRLLAVGIQQINAGAPEAALDTFSRAIRLRPEFAEAWNKRATVYYLVGDYQKSLADCDEVMKRNRFHFGALSGYGMIYLQLGLLDKSLDLFRAGAADQPQSGNGRGRTATDAPPPPQRNDARTPSDGPEPEEDPRDRCPSEDHQSERGQCHRDVQPPPA